MCRITCIFDPRNKHLHPTEKMRDCLAYGGPDAANAYFDWDNGVSLGHRRLSIIDVSEASNQPIRWKHLVMVFNGEIYNYKEIRAQLTDYQFTTDGDGEVILKAFEKWGADCVQKFRGMFSIIIWDEQLRKMTLFRDRLGVKPLYYFWKDGFFMAASEIKAFHEHPNFDKTIDQLAVSVFLQQSYIESPRSIFQFVKKLGAGQVMELDATGIGSLRNYWDAEKIYQNSSLDTRPENEILEELQSILIESFMYRMVADVPVGMFLSGGIDSSLVTALIQKRSNRQVKTFTIGFEDARYNEAQHAKLVAQHIGTDHTEIICTEHEFKNAFENLAFFYDEPFAAGSAIPTFLVSQLAKKSVKVSLSADGGDEIFGGYTKYQMALNFYPKMAGIPHPIRKGLAAASHLINPSALEKNAASLPYFKNFTNLETKFFKIRNALAANNLVDFFNTSSTYALERDLLKLHPHFHARFVPHINPHPQRLLGFLGMMDMKTFLEGEVMTKVDRATMQNALEGREPFLDQNIIEFAFRLPDHLKMRDGVSKYLLRKILYQLVPQNIIDRPKQGFLIPTHEWLHGSLRQELIAMQNDTNFAQTFDFQHTELKNIVHRFLTGRGKYVNAHFVWSLFTLYKWYQRWL